MLEAYAQQYRGYVGPRFARVRLDEVTALDSRSGQPQPLLDVEDYRRAWQEIREGRCVGITSSERLRPHAHGTAADMDEVFAACIPLESTPPPALSKMRHAAR